MNRRVHLSSHRQRDWLDAGRYTGGCPVEGLRRLGTKCCFGLVLLLIVLGHVDNRNLSGEMISVVGVLATYPGAACTVLNLV